MFTVALLAVLAVQDPRFALTVGSYAGDGSTYQAYPLPSPMSSTGGIRSAVVVNLKRFRVETAFQKHLGSHGSWSSETIGQIRLFDLRSLPVSATVQNYAAASADALYQGPSDIGLGMHRLSSLFLVGMTVRSGGADFPLAEISALVGGSRTEQTPELRLDGNPVRQFRTLSQIARNPVVSVSVRSARRVSDRIGLSGTVGYMDWRGTPSPLNADHAVTLEGGLRVGIWRWCSVSVRAFWSSDNRGPFVNRSSLSAGITVRKW